MRFGLPPQDMNITDSQWYVRDLKGKSEKHLRAFTSLFVSHLCEPGDPASKTFEDGVPKEGLNINQVLARIGMVSLIRKKVREYEKKHGLESIPSKKAEEEHKPVNEMSKDFAEFEDSSQNSAATDGKGSVDTQSEKMADENKEESEDNREEPKSENKTNEDKTGDKSKADEETEEMQTEEKLRVDGSDDTKADTKEGEDVEMKDEAKSEDQNDSKQETKPEETNGSNEEPVVNGVKEDKEREAEEEKPLIDQQFEFNIRDGGFTELQTLWYFEEQELKPGKELEIWHRRHDYWLLAGIVKHGYERWKDIHEDETFSILSEPFKSSIHIKNKFMERRLRLLEQALVFEEQFRRTAHLARLNLSDDKPESVEDKSEELSEDEDKDDKEKDKEETNDENKPLNATIHRCINQYEELLTDMKSDCGRIPQTVQRIPPIAQRLQISQKSYNQMGAQKRQFHM